MPRMIQRNIEDIKRKAKLLHDRFKPYQSDYATQEEMQQVMPPEGVVDIERELLTPEKGIDWSEPYRDEDGEIFQVNSTHFTFIPNLEWDTLGVGLIVVSNRAMGDGSYEWYAVFSVYAHNPNTYLQCALINKSKKHGRWELTENWVAFPTMKEAQHAASIALFRKTGNIGKDVSDFQIMPYTDDIYNSNLYPDGTAGRDFIRHDELAKSTWQDLRICEKDDPLSQHWWDLLAHGPVPS